MDDFQKELLAELRSIRALMQANARIVSSALGVKPNPFPWPAFSVLPEVVPVADHQAEFEDALRAFGIVLAEDV